MLCCHNISQVNIVVYLGERLKSNLKNIEVGANKKGKPCSVPLKVYPISQRSGCSFEALKGNSDDT